MAGRLAIALGKPPPRLRSSICAVLELALRSPHLLLYRAHPYMQSFAPPLALRGHVHSIAKDKAAIEQDCVTFQVVNTFNWRMSSDTSSHRYSPYGH